MTDSRIYKTNMKSWHPLKSAALLVLIGGLLISTASCRYFALERKLNPDHADFFDKVRNRLVEQLKQRRH